MQPYFSFTKLKVLVHLRIGALTTHDPNRLRAILPALIWVDAITTQLPGIFLQPPEGRKGYFLQILTLQKIVIYW